MNKLLNLSFANLINGTLAVLIWLAYAWISLGFCWATDTPQVWLLGVVVVGIFITLVCRPVLSYVVRTKSLMLQSLTCSLLGLLSVFIFFALFTDYPINFEYYLKRIWLYYLIFIIVGGLYGFMHYRR